MDHTFASVKLALLVANVSDRHLAPYFITLPTTSIVAIVRAPEAPETIAANPTVADAQVSSSRNILLSLRPRTAPVDYTPAMTSTVTRGKPSIMSPLSRRLADGPGTILGSGRGLFVFEPVSSQLSDTPIFEEGAMIGWYETATEVAAADLEQLQDVSIVELIVDDVPRYFTARGPMSRINCVWNPDADFDNNCTWVIEDGRVGVRAATDLPNSQELFIEYGWQYVATSIQSVGVRYQSWFGHADAILNTSSLLHQRLAWMLTADFNNPGPGAQLRSRWHFPSNPPATALISGAAYSDWVVASRAKSGASSSAGTGHSPGSRSLPIRMTARVMATALAATWRPTTEVHVKTVPPLQLPRSHRGLLLSENGTIPNEGMS